MSSRLASFAAIAACILTITACQSKARSVAPVPDSAAGEAFLAKMAKTQGVTRLPSGLEYRIVKSGPKDGPTAKLGDDVKVQYQGTLIDGTVFDSSYDRGEPAEFVVGEVIPGWNEALQLMRPGDVWYLYIPAPLAYGERDSGPIPANSVLVFKVELLNILPKGAGTAQG
jgi:peptidylprolyl isomerase/FKBP-type peptidyl-prolyl cis-trans isomerase FklB